jgi:lysyl-tRNA synthetase class 2
MRHGVDLLKTLPEGIPDTAALARALEAVGITTAPDDSWSDLFSRALTDRIEPGLGPGPVVLDAFPAPEAALARRQPGRSRLAERFELFACGIELANAFGELTDADEQRTRFEADMVLARNPIRRPPAAGRRLPRRPGAHAPRIGLRAGFDRLVMLATGAPRLTDVMWTPPAPPRQARHPLV